MLSKSHLVSERYGLARAMLPLTIACLLPSTLACRSMDAAGPSHLHATEFKNLPADEDAVRPDAAGRRALLGRAAAFGISPNAEREQRSILQGPPISTYKNGQLKRRTEREFSLDQIIACDYVEPHSRDKPGGKTAKFACAYTYISDDGRSKSKVLKIKYDAPELASVNTGIHAEPMTTRLLWALGYHADIVFPVQVRCRGCPHEPWRHTSAYWSIIDNETRLKDLPVGSPEHGRIEKFLVADAMRYVYQTLTRYPRYAGAKLEGQEFDFRIVDAQGLSIFQSKDGILHLPGHNEPIYDPHRRRLLQVTVGGHQDFKIARLDPSLWQQSPEMVREFSSALVEWKHNSIPIETYYHEGWSFNASSYEPDRLPELRYVVPDNPQLKQARQELALLSAFIAHADNKAEQQRLICLDPEKIEAEDDDCDEGGDPRWPSCQPGTDKIFSTCNQPALMLQDVGFSLGYGSRMLGRDANGRLIPDTSKTARDLAAASAQGWLEAPLFVDDTTCTTKVHPWVTGAEIQEQVSDAARLALVQKLRDFVAHDQNLDDLFRLGRLHHKARRHRGADLPKLAPPPAQGYAGGTEEQALIEEFKKVFKARLAKLEAKRCP